MSYQEYQQKQSELNKLSEKIKDYGRDAAPELLQREQDLRDELKSITKTHRSGLYFPDYE